MAKAKKSSKLPNLPAQYKKGFFPLTKNVKVTPPKGKPSSRKGK